LFLIWTGILPDPWMITEYIQTMDSSLIFFILFLMILLESIIYVWFYLPGQFIAVLVVFSYASSFLDVLFLSLISIIAVTVWAFINYNLWYYYFKNKNETQETIHYKSLLISMIHINTIALYIFDQGQKAAPKKIIYLTGLLNFPYYILIIWVTFLLKNEILSMSENAYVLFGILFLWLWYSVYKEKQKNIKIHDRSLKEI
jgi:membrane-associated protein